jgi:two-component system, sporulation sensor kinase E
MQELESGLWKTITDTLNSGLVVIDARGKVVYANDEAARLLGRSCEDVMALDMDDLIALWQPERLDGERLGTLMRNDLLGDRPEETFQVATFDRRLLVSAFRLEAGGGALTIVQMREDVHWRSDLITRTVMEEMNSPIVFAAEYSETLLRRIEDGDAYATELSQITRIILNSIARARTIWDALRRLYDTDARAVAPPNMAPVSLSNAIRDAVKEIEGQALRSMPTLQLFLPGDLPNVRASARHLHAALCSLLAEAMSRLSDKETMTIAASDKEGYVRVDLTLGASGGLVRNYLFDGMPLAIVEQVIVQHGGRIWIDSKPGQPIMFSFSLPTWE